MKRDQHVERLQPIDELMDELNDVRRKIGLSHGIYDGPPNINACTHARPAQKAAELF